MFFAVKLRFFAVKVSFFVAKIGYIFGINDCKKFRNLFQLSIELVNLLFYFVNEFKAKTFQISVLRRN